MTALKKHNAQLACRCREEAKAKLKEHDERVETQDKVIRNGGGESRGGKGGVPICCLPCPLDRSLRVPSKTERAPILLLIETPPTFGHSSRLFHIFHKTRGGGGCTQFVHGRSRMTVDPRIPIMPGWSTSGFHQQGRHSLHQARSAVRCSASRMKGELHPSKNRS